MVFQIERCRLERITHEMRRRRWAAIIRECNESGQKKKDWLAEHGIDSKQFYRWQNKLRMEVGTDLILAQQNTPAVTADSKTPEFGLLPSPDPPGTINASAAVIRKGELEIELSEHISDHFLLRIMKAVKNA